MTPINSRPQLGDVLFYKNLKGKFIRHTVVERPPIEGVIQRPVSDGIIYIKEDNGKIDSIIVEFKKGEFNTRLFTE